MPLPNISRFRLIVAGLVLLAILLAAGKWWLGERLEVRRAERGNLQQSVVASGRVRTPQRLEIAAQITGRVLAVKVREGDEISVGQILLQLDDSELRAAQAQARASLSQSDLRWRQLGELSRPLAEQNLRQANANLAQAQKQFERINELVKKGFYSPAQRDDGRRALSVAETQARSAELQLAGNQPNGVESALSRSAIEQARAALSVAEAKLGYATLNAPVAGVVLARSVEVGDTAQPGKVLLVIAPNAETELTAQIDEKNIALLKVGQLAQASADAFPNAQFKAEITYIAPAVDALRGSVEIRLRVPAAPAYLKNEMTVSVDITSAQRQDVVLVPADSVRDIATAAPWIMLVREGKTQRQPVRLGLRGSGKVEISEGIAAGDALLPASASLPENRRVLAVDR